MIEIPGEEAVTDPGIPHEVTNPEIRAEGGASWLSSLVAVGIVLGSVIGWWVFEQDDSSTVTPAKRTDIAAIPLSAHEDAEFDEPTVISKTAQPKRRVVTQHVTSQGRPPANDMKTADASVVPTKKAPGLGGAPTSVFDSIGAAPVSRAPASIVLKDSLKIEEMVGRVLNRGARQLEQCYNQALKLNPGIKGAWYVDFTISKDGKPVAVSVEALEAPHREIEGCIARKVDRWRFQRIAEPLDVARRYRFGG